MKKYDIYAMGNALVDAVYNVDESFIKTHNIEKGIMTLIDEPRQTALMSDLHRLKGEWTPGGSAANTVIGASQFGSHGYYSCRIANDDFGTFFSKEMHDLGVNLSADRAQLPEGVTGKCLVMVTKDADRTMNTFLGISSEFSEKDLELEALSASKLLYVEGYLVTSDLAFEACLKAIRFAKAHDVKVAITLSDPAIVKFFKPKFQEMIKEGVDLLFANEEELMTLTDGAGYRVISEQVGAYAITKGAEGATLWDGVSQYQVECPPVKAIDTNGAGDMFAGAFLSAHLAGSSFQKAGSFACAAASTVVTKHRPRLLNDEAQEVFKQFFSK